MRAPPGRTFESEWLARDSPETNSITIKPDIASHAAEQFSWVSLSYCSPPGCPFPIKSLALSAHVSPRTIHFRVLDKSPVSGPGRGPPSCNRSTQWASNPIPRCRSRGNQNLKRHLYPTIIGTITKTQKQLKCTKADEWRQKMGYMYTMQYYSDIEKDEIMPLLVTGEKLEIIILSEVYQKEKDKYHMISLTCGIQNMIKWN